MRVVRLIGAAAVAVAALLGPVAVEAHVFFHSSVPAPDAAVRAPRALRITFTGPVEPAFTGIDLARGGHPVVLGAAALDPADPATLIVRLTTPLGAGRYRVHWHAVGGDTHRTEGTYDFTVVR